MSKIAEIRRKKQDSYQGLNELLSPLASGDWERPIYGHGDGWVARDVLAHLVTAGAGLLQVAQLIVKGALRAPPDFDLDRWNKRQVEKQAELTPTELLNGLAALHERTLVYLDQLAADESVLDRRGQHAVFGDTSVEYVLRRIYRHEREHAQEIRAAL